ncbi:MAG: glycosyltransferase family 2 protein [Bacteroidota bacterium]
MKKISFVIPVFRNQGSITPTYQKITSLFGKVLPGYDYEFVFVHDGSDDNSLDELMALHASDSKAKVISFSRNFGQVAAIIAGLKHVTGEASIIMSADLQEPIELIENMIHEWSKGNEIIICSRQEREDGFWAAAFSKVFYSLMKLGNSRMPRGGFDFMLLDQKAVEELNRIDERNRFFQGDVLWLGFGVKFIRYNRIKREIGKSQWTLSRKIKYFIDGMVNTSYLPIRFMSLFGFITACLGFLYAGLIIYNRLVHNFPFKGWAPIMVLILIIGGLIMLMLGFIGEYIWRIYDESRKRPVYIIKEKHL